MPSFFLTHAEVVVDPDAPIESWHLSDSGRARAAAAHRSAWRPGTARIVSSEERKALETADLFARPAESVRGWERAVDAQARIVDAVRRHTADGSDVTVVSHGAVGALLLADLTGAAITRDLDQPGMGSVFTFDPRAWRATSGWTRVTP